MEPGFLHRAFLVAAAGLSLVLGAALRVPSLVAFALALLLLVALARSTARRRLARLDGRRSLAAGAFEGEEVRVEIALENHGRAAVPFVEVVDSFGAALADRKALLDPGPLRPGRRHRLAYRTQCSRLWGVYTVGPLSLSVSDPLGLFFPRRPLPDVRPFDVFPQVHAVGGLDRLGARASFSPSEATADRAGRSAAYLGVRDFRPGDEVRRVHWPATARYARPMVKEFELDLTPCFTLFIDLGREQRAGTGRKSTLEYVVRTAASLLAAAARRGDTVQLFGEGRESLALPPGRGGLHLAHALDRLIRVRQDGALSLLDLFGRERAAVPPGSTAALVSASLFVDAGELAEALGWMRARRVQPVVVAVDMDSFLPIDRRPRPRADVEAQAETLRTLARSHGSLLALFEAEQDLPAELGRPDWLEAA
ncbi:MAG TPA: DUF58 domain-containing protein [Vicinamibacteria bacterium]|nr:DUF58 domain-containing protein [Vicinamibacteria bacterium]